MFLNERLKLNLKIQFKENKLGYISLSIILILVLFSTFSFLSPYDPNKIDLSNKLVNPSLKHLFGTDEMGRDYFTRSLYGGRTSLMVGFISMIISTSLGTIIGTFSGYIGGKIDNILMRIIDILMCIPTFFLILIINAYLKPGIENIIIIIGLFGWMDIARIVRSQTLSLKEREYVLCSKALGAPNKRIVFKHIIPNVIPSVMVASTINIASAILTESSLSFLGLGVRAPNSSWGSMLQNAQGFISSSPYLAIFPGLFILFTVLNFNILGDIFATAFDPKANK
ncbi:ABC transporter permease [Clostridium botulinum]|uniref:Oligopeptide ABC transporter permease n=1 Tax=Clostridium botulinum CFSAN001627 TaxID=1232189 RepID=M1ZUQ5_CLOBO|nr:ABC transporter permease [Clostridium botulinum]EKN40398.1 oligopeptide ABC transporter permease [Clostridium botulinum CFSAN001627]APC79488.1 binding--dependent transport system inner membrane component family protein [Clostridium botulinum]APC83880.1 binding--dependent transport system inner membrane component family protein [Clostridium botulinum]EDT83126.1 putative oligopeptide ABC transporter, permease protein [Clostridium botulinum NCTC 2916]KEI80583.1 peptide ABC transporter permease